MAEDPIYPDLKNASVLITGGGSGIGAALTEGFVAQGAQVAFIDINEDVSRKLSIDLGERYGHAPVFLHADLRDPDAIGGAVDEAARDHGLITILINNAAWDDRHELADVDAAYWDNNIAINLRHAFFTAQAVAEGMKASGGGAIVNFTSTSFMLNIGEMPAYTSAKAGIIGLTKGLAGKLGPFGIRVNAIAPGWVMTERQKELWVTDEALNEMLSRQCLKQALQPEDMVGPTLFLASSASSAITAQTVIADGGMM